MIHIASGQLGCPFRVIFFSCCIIIMLCLPILLLMHNSDHIVMFSMIGYGYKITEGEVLSQGGCFAVQLSC